MALGPHVAFIASYAVPLSLTIDNVNINRNIGLWRKIHVIFINKLTDPKAALRQERMCVPELGKLYNAENNRTRRHDT
jgi:hypothetical protein